MGDGSTLQIMQETSRGQGQRDEQDSEILLVNGGEACCRRFIRRPILVTNGAGFASERDVANRSACASAWNNCDTNSVGRRERKPSGPGGQGAERRSLECSGPNQCSGLYEPR